MDSEQTTFTIQSTHQTLEQTVWTACLVVVRGVGTGNKILLNRARISIGRADDADVRLAKAGVSRQHALITPIDAERFQIEDLGSTNGTYVNGQRVDHAILAEQDLIAIGESRLKFIAADSPDQPYYEELYCQAQLDKALQVYNKHYFLTRLEDELRRHQRAEAPLSLILFDVDHFKRLNDSYGHLAGDAALVHLCELAKQSLRESDVLCRYGGEEFAIILGQTEASTALAIAEEIRERVATTAVNHAEVQIEMTVSLGISSLTADASRTTAEALIVQADRALYAAKHAGRNRILQFEPTAMAAD
jgi:diguanylate cyclase (GGDEF)-like protein